jgi:hypothetical protein
MTQEEIKSLPFLKEETFGSRTQLTFVGDSLEIYIPSDYFDDSVDMAEIVSEYIDCMGIFCFKEGDAVYQMTMPIRMKFGFSSRSKKTMRLAAGMPDADYDIFTLNRGDAFVYDLLHQDSSKDCEFIFSKMIAFGKIPATVGYSQSLDLVLQGLISSGIKSKIGVPSLCIEAILSELYRCKGNYSQPFRKMAGKGKGTDYDFKLVRMTKIPELNSTFTGICGEDSNHQVVSAIYRTKAGLKDEETPIENLLKY